MGVSFDECFQTRPIVSPPANFDEFWKEAINDLKNVPIKKQYKSNLKLNALKETNADVQYQSLGNINLDATLITPRWKNSCPIVVHFHDYNGTRHEKIRSLTELGIGQLLVSLRGHDLPNQVEISEGQEHTLGYFRNFLDNPKQHYLCLLYVDVIRTIEFLRLTETVDATKIILHGKNLGASMALFGAAFSDRVKGIILETPNFCYVNSEQMELEVSWAKELNSALNNPKFKKNTFKTFLGYFDSLNLVSKIQIPTLITVGMEDTVSSPKSAFALMNNLNCDKRMQIFPTEGNECGGEKGEAMCLDFYKEFLLETQTQ